MSTVTSQDSSTPPGGYSAVSRVLHWLVACGIVLQFILGQRAEEAAAIGNLPSQLAALAQHKSIGITLLGLALLRLVWRLVQPPVNAPYPPAPSAPAVFAQKRMATFMHAALYALLFFLPLSGWLMSSASGYSVAWFNLVQLPDLIAPSEAKKALLQTLHNAAGKLLLALAIGHILAALKHWLVDKDGVMARMGGPLSTLLFVATLATGIAFTWPGSHANTTATQHAETVVEAIVQPLTAQPSAIATPALWVVDSADSYIRFTAEQAGAEFTGEWQRFSAEVYFDPDKLDASSAQVTIDANSLETNDEERDGILAGLDWFDSEQHPQVTFSANDFAVTNAGFVTTAVLQIRGASYPVTFSFAVVSEANTHTLTGTARLDRLALKLGTIEWLDTEWVGQFVAVQVRVSATTAP